MSTQTPDIQSILAALASQRQAPPAGGQAPGQPPVPGALSYPPSDQHSPAAYPPPPGSTSYGAPPGYPIPQPAASGNMDLSAIRPVNSGTVSIADAIAKAKSYAAEAGVASYDRPVVYSPHSGRGDGRDSRDGRDYRRRSRSKSPAPRRDNYRENYNAYRDERREERPRDYGNHGARYEPDDRSRGAQYRSSNGRDRDRSPPRGGDDNSETIQIEGNLVGLIIGRQGENLRRIEGETGCRVQFLGTADNSSLRQCKITGPQARRADVKEAIDRIIRDTGVNSTRGAGAVPERPVKDQRGGAAALREGEDHMQIMVPDPTVGLIIGRGGETIRDLQERSGCHINIVGETKSINGLRPVNLIGTLEAAQKAKDFIMEIVDSDSRGENGGAGATVATGKRPLGGQSDSHSYDHQSRPGPPHRGGDGGQGGDKIQEIIRVPSDAVGMIIGKRGDTIREIQNVTGCKINVSQSSGEGEIEREIALIGSQDSINRAKRSIDEKIDAVRMKGSGPSGGGGHGGRGGGRGGDHSGYGQHSAPMSNSAPPSNPPQQQAAADGSDPYAQYGGYNNYLALWYQQWMGAAGAGGQPPGDAPQPPSGTQ